MEYKEWKKVISEEISRVSETFFDTYNTVGSTFFVWYRKPVGNEPIGRMVLSYDSPGEEYFQYPSKVPTNIDKFQLCQWIRTNIMPTAEILNNTID